MVHGLWPETDSYGDSKCKEPEDLSDPQIIYPCYQQPGEDDADLLSFEVHECVPTPSHCLDMCMLHHLSLHVILFE